MADRESVDLVAVIGMLRISILNCIDVEDQEIYELVMWIERNVTANPNRSLKTNSCEKIRQLVELWAIASDLRIDAIG